MTVSDPLIKQLKGYVKLFVESGDKVQDDNPSLLPFCECLEKCLRKGVVARMNSIGIPIFPDAWSWMEDVAKIRHESLYSYSSIVESVQQNQKVAKCVGKLRLLIRSCLNRKCLHLPVGYIIRINNSANLYYSSNSSIVGDEILGEIFYSVLLQLSFLSFKLDVRNASFLDETWELGQTVVANFVPCRALGISVCFSDEKALIIKIDKNSVTAEDERIQVGDVLDEINGQFVSSCTRGYLKRILFEAVGRPMTVHVIKFRNEKTGGFYWPISKVIKRSEIGYMKALLSKNFSQSGESVENVKKTKELRPGHIIFTYCGTIDVGHVGEKQKIEETIEKFVENESEHRKVPVRFECLELGVNVNEDPEKKLLFNYSYMEISSCGRSPKFPEYFAFVTGDPNRAETTNFKVHVFHHKDGEETQALLLGLGQGLQRTNFVV